ncbi:hypothetical protein SAMN02745866_04015 [Alteromonadaceae bacterium Bs31]|nr:hypothetical protein SAMN02745866_04015 [Alteromonadaceae bacterium Bs31]
MPVRATLHPLTVIQITDVQTACFGALYTFAWPVKTKKDFVRVGKPIKPNYVSMRS